MRSFLTMATAAPGICQAFIVEVTILSTALTSKGWAAAVTARRSERDTANARMRWIVLAALAMIRCSIGLGKTGGLRRPGPRPWTRLVGKALRRQGFPRIEGVSPEGFANQWGLGPSAPAAGGPRSYLGPSSPSHRRTIWLIAATTRSERAERPTVTSAKPF